MRGYATVLAGLWIFVGFYLIRYGVFAGLIERSIRMTKFTREKAAGPTAVGWGLFYVGLGFALLIAAAFLLLGAVAG